MFFLQPPTPPPHPTHTHSFTHTHTHKYNIVYCWNCYNMYHCFGKCVQLTMPRASGIRSSGSTICKLYFWTRNWISSDLSCWFFNCMVDVLRLFAESNFCILQIVRGHLIWNSMKINRWTNKFSVLVPRVVIGYDYSEISKWLGL